MTGPLDLFAGLKRVVGDWPQLNANSLPQKERRAGNAIQQSLIDLCNYASDFGAAVRLFDDSMADDARAALTGSAGDGLARMHIAARDGAVTIYHFGKTLEKGFASKNCPTLWKHVDQAQLRSARRLFSKTFPDLSEIRHSVGHAAELKDEAEKHKVDGVVGDMFPTLQTHLLSNVHTKILIRNSLNGRTFRNTFNGQLRTYEVSTDTLARLNNIRKAVYAAFAQCPPTYS